MRNLTVEGRLGRDASIQKSEKGVSYLSFTIAHNEGPKDNQRTEWINVVSFNPDNFTNILQYLKKGSFVFVSGRQELGLYKGNDGELKQKETLYLYDVTFGGGGQKKEEEENGGNANTEANTEVVRVSVKKTNKQPVEASYEDGDDLPF